MENIPRFIADIAWCKRRLRWKQFHGTQSAMPNIIWKQILHKEYNVCWNIMFMSMKEFINI